MVTCVSLLNTIFLYPFFVILFISDLSLFWFYFLNIIVSFGFIFFLPLVGGISWHLWSTLPTDPNFLNFIGPMRFIPKSCAIGFTITPLGKEWSWSVSLWEMLWCYRTSGTIRPGNYRKEFYTLVWNNSLNSLSLAENFIQKGKGMLQQWVHFICLKKKKKLHSFLRVNMMKRV